MENTILQQGRFTSTGVDRTLILRSDVDWIKVYNYTTITTPATEGVEYYWQRGMADGGGIEWQNTVGTAILTIGPNSFVGTNPGFSIVDSSISNPFGVAYACTTSAAAAPVITYTGGTGAVPTGSIVKLDSVANAGVYQTGLSMYEFQVTYNAVNTNTITYATPTVQTAGTSGNVRQVKYDPIYYPRQYFIINMTAGSPTTVTFSADHGFTVGQKIRLQLPVEFSAQWNTALDGVEVTILTVPTANTITVYYDSTGFAAFAFPVGIAITKPAKAIPLGQDTAASLILGSNILGDATYNGSYLGMKLFAGADSPAGQNNDVVYWIAGKSFSVSNL